MEYLIVMFFDKAGIYIAATEGLAAGEVVEKWNIGSDAGDFIVAQGTS